jgi:uncharacterized repeat protein (TIGR03803 family)
MRQIRFEIAASCLAAMLLLLPITSSAREPTSKEKVIYSFQGGADGAGPMSDLTLDTAGNLYGTTSQGGTGTACKTGCGTVFELKRTKGVWNEEVLYSFLWGKDGLAPEAGVIFDTVGNLYGTTQWGGSGNAGTVFKLIPNSHGGWTEAIIYSFSYTGSAGMFPAADLTFDPQGNLYGTTTQGGDPQCGCGAVFELTPQSNGTWTEATIHAFTGAPDGYLPISGIVLDSAGNLYGVTESGGIGSCGRVYSIPGCGAFYRLTRNRDSTWTESVLYSFVRGGGLGVLPSGGVLFDQANHVFGVTRQGGDGFGTVFDLSDSLGNGWRQHVLHIAYGKPDGIAPVGRLVTDTNGNLFGVEQSVVFELAHSQDGWIERILHTFVGPPDGGQPSAGLTFDSSGNLYGATQTGGTETPTCRFGCGTVYEITP